MSWYYADQGKQVGPVSEAELQSSLSTGVITEETLIWRDGLPEWIKYGDAIATGRVQRSGNTMVAASGSGVCVECNQLFSQDEMASFGGQLVCSSCKPIYVQKVKEGLHVGSGFVYAGFWKRFAAVFLDGIIMQIASIPISVGAIAVFGQGNTTGTVVSSVLGAIVGIAYMVYFIGKLGATPGKMALKIKVVRPNGSTIGYGRALGRYFAQALSAMILCIGYLMMLWDPEKRTLHDRIVDSRVIMR